MSYSKVRITDCRDCVIVEFMPPFVTFFLPNNILILYVVAVDKTSVSKTRTFETSTSDTSRFGCNGIEGNNDNDNEQQA